MPLYEYICQDCGKKYTWLVGVVANSAPPTCDRCGAVRGERKQASRFARLRSEEDALESLADPNQIGDMDDPSTIRRWAKEVGKGLGEDLGDDFDEMIESELSGTAPTEDDANSEP